MYNRLITNLLSWRGPASLAVSGTLNQSGYKATSVASLTKEATWKSRWADDSGLCTLLPSGWLANQQKQLFFYGDDPVFIEPTGILMELQEILEFLGQGSTNFRNSPKTPLSLVMIRDIPTEMAMGAEHLISIGWWRYRTFPISYHGLREVLPPCLIQILKKDTVILMSWWVPLVFEPTNQPRETLLLISHPMHSVKATPTKIKRPSSPRIPWHSKSVLRHPETLMVNPTLDWTQLLSSAPDFARLVDRPASKTFSTYLRYAFRI